MRTGLAAFAVVWTLTEAAAFFLVDGQSRPPAWLLAPLAAFCIVLGWVTSTPMHEGVLTWAEMNLAVAVSRGDLLDFDGPIAVASNDIFDDQLGPGRVDPYSLHGQLISRCQQSGDSFGAALASADYWRSTGEALPSGIDGRDRFPLGSTARTELGGQTAFLLALSRSDDVLPDSAPSLALLVSALDSLWRAMNENRSGQAIGVPLIGSGAYGLALASELNLELVIRTYLDVSKRQRAPSPTLHVVLSGVTSSAIDLRRVQKAVGATSLARLRTTARLQS